MTIDQLEDALRKAGANMAEAARILAASSKGRLSITRQAVQKRVKDSARLQEVIAEVEEETLDLAENVVLTHVRDGDFNAARFYLLQRGKTRGWAPRIEGNLNANLNLNISVSDARDAFYRELDEMAARRRSIEGGRAGGNGMERARPISEET